MSDLKPTSQDLSNSTVRTPSEPSVPDPNFVVWFRQNSIPIGGMMLVVLIACVASHFWKDTGWSKAKDITDVYLNITQTLALLLGGWWFCFKYIKGRTYKESLVPKISGRIVKIASKTYLVANIQIKNVGQSVVEFAPDASSLRVFGYKETKSDQIVSVDDAKLAQLAQLMTFILNQMKSSRELDL